MNKKILIIGSNSFSGSHFANYCLKHDNDVIGVSRSNEPSNAFLPYKWEEKNSTRNKNLLKFYKIDLNNDIDKLINIIDEFQPEYIINFAAQGMVAESWLNPINWYKTNVLSQVAIHDKLRSRKFIKKYLHFTTPEVYGSTDSGWIKENDYFKPSTPYAISRAACDLHLQSFFNAYAFPVVFTRAANVYGEGQQLYRIIPRTILSAKTKVPMQLHGKGISQRAFIHIKDAVSATYQLLLHADAGTSWHISTNQALTIRALVEKICMICGVEFTDIVEESEERLGKDQSYLLDSNAIRQKFDWEDKINLETGINSTISWVDDNLELFKNLSWKYKHKK